MTTDQQGWVAEQDIRNGLPVLLLKYNDDPAGMITLPEDTKQEEIDRLARIIAVEFNGDVERDFHD